ncbi:hypothetical protein MNBD_GAMMA12-2673 [hydrothermal vent metagenome]|uniref:DUF4401 domain-containing protein n=1 Tax=hydrothermal vent metagenome TaxID=652676 RepID=A0A3B0Z5M7_9ZZZZ
MIFRSPPTIARLLEIATTNKIINDPTQIKELLKKPSSAHPWYIQTALGISAWIAAVIFSSYINTTLIKPLVVMGLITHQTSNSIGVVIGISLYIIGALVYRYKPNSIICRQFSLSISLAGMLLSLFYLGIPTSFIPEWTTGLFLLVAETIVFYFHSDPVRRYIAITNGLPVVIFNLPILQLDLVCQLIVPIGLYAVYLFWNKQEWQLKIAPDIIKPLKYGLPVALIVITYWMVNAYQVPNYIWDICNFMIALIFFRVFYSELERYQLLTPGNLIAGFILIMTLAMITINSPGIMTAITVIFIGFQNANKLLTISAILAFAYFLVNFYFSIEVHLIDKATLLIIGGVLFLITARILHSQVKKLETIT